VQPQRIRADYKFIQADRGDAGLQPADPAAVRGGGPFHKSSADCFWVDAADCSGAVVERGFHSADFRSLSEMFDLARNVEYAANFLKSLKAQEGSWTLAEDY